jgi:hypothetical protein
MTNILLSSLESHSQKQTDRDIQEGISHQPTGMDVLSNQEANQGGFSCTM